MGKIPASAHYREADTPGESCSTCDFFNPQTSTCEMFDNAPVESAMTCDDWAGRIDKAESYADPTAGFEGLSPDDISLLATSASTIALERVTKATTVRAAGLAVRAADTGRVLMIQRSHEDKADPARGTWEFPGGKLNDGEHPHAAAKREWQEETGARLPRGRHVGEWRSGVYHGFIHEVPSENSVKINLDPERRRVMNPDDPDCDHIEVAAWWDPAHLRNMRALRPELRNSRPWQKVGIAKGQARPAEMNLRVNGVSAVPGGHRVYRMVTKDGRYVGSTSPTRVRARKGDVLKIQANDFLQDAASDDLRWQNAHVAGYSDAPHTWRDLQAMAGDTLYKDGAPGPAGDLPAADDQGWASSDFPSGPTLSAVHVNMPLPSLSVVYIPDGTKRKAKKQPVLRGEFLPVSKAERWRQLVYGVVLEPNVLDSQDDYMLAHHVEKTAHNYLKKAIRGASSVAKLQHRAQGFFKSKPSIVPVESYIAPCDFSYDGMDMIKKGTWVMVMHVEDPGLWQDFLDGKYTGFSVGGSGVRQSMHVPVDLVDHGYIAHPQPSEWPMAPSPGQLGSFV